MVHTATLSSNSHNSDENSFMESWPLFTPEDHDFNKFESKLPGDALTQVSAFLANWFWA